jgi:hypothetical protein
MRNGRSSQVTVNLTINFFGTIRFSDVGQLVFGVHTISVRVRVGCRRSPMGPSRNASDLARGVKAS